MNKEELEQKIKNKESVFIVTDNSVVAIQNYDKVIKMDNNKINFMFGEFPSNTNIITNINEIFSTEAQAQHYLDNSNITRIEKFPFVTWEEFKKIMWITFLSSDNVEYDIMTRIDGNDRPYLIVIDTIKEIDSHKFFTFEYSEKGFYEAYEEARKLFLGE